MERFFWICVAGAAGTGTRYLVALWAARQFGTNFPYGTLIVNLAGCFAIATLMQLGAAVVWSPTIRLALTVGFIGGLTTYSSFNYETSRLAQEGAVGAAAANVLVTLLGGFVAGWGGWLCSRQLLGE
ncbi:MAG: fluoride efflux transporter CrcB [Vicinamibacterales bacterium]